MFERVDASVSPDRGVGHVVDSTNAHVMTLDAIALDDCSPSIVRRISSSAMWKALRAKCFRALAACWRSSGRERLCEIHNEKSRQLVLNEFSRFDYVCENCDENHILALPK